MIVGYARVSTRDQNPRLQLDALAEVCDRVVEERKSGKRGSDRPVWRELLLSLERGDTLTVWKLDRAGRSIIDLYETLNMLRERGVNFRVLTSGIDTSTREGRFFFGILALFAEYERGIILERSTAGKHARMKDGKHPGGPRLYGFETDHQTIVEGEAAHLVEAAEYVLAGGRLAALAGKWNHDDIPTASGAASWRDSTLRNMLLNPRIIPIVGAETHERLEALLSRPIAERQGRPPTSLLNGLLVCGNCKALLYAGHVAGHKAAYTCKTKHASTGYRGCGKVTITRAGLERYIYDRFEDAVCGPGFERVRGARLQAMLGAQVDPAELAGWRQDLEDLGPVVSSRFATDTQRELYDDLKAKVGEATRRLLAQPDADVLTELPTAADKLQAKWASWSDAERRRALRLLIDHVTVKPARLGKRQGSRFAPEERVEIRWKF